MGKRLSVLMLLVFLGMVWSSLNINAEPSVPAVYIFGDSTFDVGTNHFLPECTAQADMKFYGIDFPNSQPTGRFTNGFNTADQIAIHLGFQMSPPPFLLLVQNDTAYFRSQIIKGVNFASGGSGIQDQTGKIRFKRVISLGEQIQQFATVHSNISEHLNCTRDAEAKINESLFLLSVGSNDFFDLYYFNNNTVCETMKQDFLINVTTTYKIHLESLKNLGARKFGILSVPPLGCVPAMRLTNGSNCNEDLNAISDEFHTVLKGALQNLSSQFPEMKYSLVNSFNMSMAMIKSAQVLGLENITSPCCANSTFSCGPNSDVCQNRDKFLFWDQIHPTQHVSELAADFVFSGDKENVVPISFAELIPPS